MNLVAPLLEVRDLRISFTDEGRVWYAVKDMSFSVRPGQTLAVIGESGAGKSLACRALVGLLPHGALVAGSIRFRGKELVGLSEKEMRRHRGTDIAIVFQDSDGALNATMRVGRQITEALRAHRRMSRRVAQERGTELLHLLGLPAPRRHFFSYPHQLSGGMRQRVLIAIALAGEPDLLIVDEATRSLDLATQLETMQLLMALQRRLGMAIIMVSHDLRLTESVADDVLVMHAARLLECARTEDLFGHSRVPYTRALLEAVPRLEEPLPTYPSANLKGTKTGRTGRGCAFAGQCARAVEICSEEEPALVAEATGHRWACWQPHDRGLLER